VRANATAQRELELRLAVEAMARGSSSPRRAAARDSLSSNQGELELRSRRGVEGAPGGCGSGRTPGGAATFSRRARALRHGGSRWRRDGPRGAAARSSRPETSLRSSGLWRRQRVSRSGRAPLRRLHPRRATRTRRKLGLWRKAALPQQRDPELRCHHGKAGQWRSGLRSVARVPKWPTTK
jgi:hypothetical protein